MLKKIKIIAGVFVLAMLISYFLIDVNEKQFDQVQWKKNPFERYKMASDIIETNMLFGKKKTEVISVLGNNTETSTLIGKEHLVYPLGKIPSFFESKEETLIVVFENAKVFKIIYSHE